MARVSVIEFWRDIYGSPPSVMMDRYLYTAATGVVSLETVNIGGGGLSPFHPPVGTKVGFECGNGVEEGDLIEYFSKGDNSGVTVTVTENAASCCELAATDFSIVRTNNTHPTTPNGTIVVTTPTLDVGEFEVSIDDGENFITQTDDEFRFENLPAGNYEVIIKTITGVCNVVVNLVISDNIIYPPPIIEETTLPNLYSPVFYPITMGFSLKNNEATVKQDVEGTYLEVDNSDGREYLGSLPIIKIFDNTDYAGSYQITGVDDVDTPTKFYFDKTFTTEQVVKYVPFDRQVFQLFAEVNFNNYQKIADITVYPHEDTGEYLIRLEGFLQAVFKINPPINNGDELALLRNYYVVPVGFEVEETPTILKAVYSAIPSLTNYLGSLIPLGPAPINFINEQTQKGLPVLFSYIDLATGRIKNVTSSYQTQITQAGTLVYIPALPLNTYDLTWVNPAGAIADLQVSPALPAWIVLGASPSDTVQLAIDTGPDVDGGDYDGEDYDEEDYLTGGPNAIIGCYEYEFSDGVTPLFTLQICIFPIQKSEPVCKSGEDLFNIAWVNREGGWSSYVFEGRKVFGKDIGTVREYKKGLELRKSAVEEVYDNAEVTIASKAIKDLIFISSLRQSIQAYLWDDATLQWSTPIILDRASFPVYSKPFKQIEAVDKFTFRYATEIVIQSQ